MCDSDSKGPAMDTESHATIETIGHNGAAMRNCAHPHTLHRHSTKTMACSLLQLHNVKQHYTEKAGATYIRSSLMHSTTQASI